MIDLHVHIWRCRHGEGTAAECVQAAAARGLSTIAITEHLPLARELVSLVPDAGEYAMPAAEFTEYCAEVREAAILGQDLGVEVLLGAEADLDAITLVSADPAPDLTGFDVVLGSVHFIDDWAFDDPACTARYAEWRLEDLWDRYFSDVITAARTGRADVIAHADLVKKFTRCPEGGAGTWYREAASAFAEAGVAVEISSAGLRKPCKELYPAAGFLRELRANGVRVTLGSDAHSPSDVGAGLDLALQAARDAGYTSVIIFRQRIAEEVGLDVL